MEISFRLRVLLAPFDGGVGFFIPLAIVSASTVLFYPDGALENLLLLFRRVLIPWRFLEELCFFASFPAFKLICPIRLLVGKLILPRIFTSVSRFPLDACASTEKVIIDGCKL